MFCLPKFFTQILILIWRALLWQSRKSCSKNAIKLRIQSLEFNSFADTVAHFQMYLLPITATQGMQRSNGYL